jgi:hypothetical protein
MAMTTNLMDLVEKYLWEFDFRYNLRMARGISDGERAHMVVRQAAGKRLMFQPSGAA